MHTYRVVHFLIKKSCCFFLIALFIQGITLTAAQKLIPKPLILVLFSFDKRKCFKLCSPLYKNLLESYAIIVTFVKVAKITLLLWPLSLICPTQKILLHALTNKRKQIIRYEKNIVNYDALSFLFQYFPAQKLCFFFIFSDQKCCIFAKIPYINL